MHRRIKTLEENLRALQRDLGCQEKRKRREKWLDALIAVLLSVGWLEWIYVFGLLFG